MQRGMAQPKYIRHDWHLAPNSPPTLDYPTSPRFSCAFLVPRLVGLQGSSAWDAPCVASTDEIPPVFKAISVKFSKPVLRPYNVHGTVLNLGTYEN